MAVFAGLIDFEGGPTDEVRLRNAAAAFPDEAFAEAELSVVPGCAFGMRPLRAEFSPPEFERPLGNGRFVVAGDTRLDDRSELLRVLDDPALSPGSSDAHLVLAAIVKWGSAFVDHLTGEFAIVAWDRRERELLLARDHFGARPLYYSRFGSKIAVASSTMALRRLVGSEPDLRPDTVADYIVFGELTDRAATFFRGLDALPPAHVAKCSPDRLEVSRYWDYPEESEILASGRDEIREELMRLLHVAVNDRLRSNRGSIQLSGGLDSTALAVVMLDEQASRGGQVSGLTMSHEALFEDDEPRLAEAVGRLLGIPVAKLDVQHWKLWQDTAVPGAMTRERPGWGPFVAAWREAFRLHAGAGPVAFSGDGGDYLLATERQPLRWWWRRGDVRAIARVATRALRAGIRLRAGLRSKGPSIMPAARIPDWLDSDLLRQSGIQERNRDYVIDDRVWSRLPRPTLRARLIRVRIEQEFELAHPSVTHVPVVYSLPFFDRRLIERAFSWAPFPWLEEKYVLRDAMAGRLPGEVLRRPKQGLSGDPLPSMIEAGLVNAPPVCPGDLSGLCLEGRFPAAPSMSDLDTIPTWCRAIETALWRRSLT